MNPTSNSVDTGSHGPNFAANLMSKISAAFESGAGNNSKIFSSLLNQVQAAPVPLPAPVSQPVTDSKTAPAPKSPATSQVVTNGSASSLASPVAELQNKLQQVQDRLVGKLRHLEQGSVPAPQTNAPAQNAPVATAVTAAPVAAPTDSAPTTIQTLVDLLKLTQLLQKKLADMQSAPTVAAPVATTTVAIADPSLTPAPAVTPAVADAAPQAAPTVNSATPDVLAMAQALAAVTNLAQLIEKKLGSLSLSGSQGTAPVAAANNNAPAVDPAVLDAQIKAGIKDLIAAQQAGTTPVSTGASAVVPAPSAPETAAVNTPKGADLPAASGIKDALAVLDKVLAVSNNAPVAVVATAVAPKGLDLSAPSGIKEAVAGLDKTGTASDTMPASNLQTAPAQTAVNLPKGLDFSAPSGIKESLAALGNTPTDSNNVPVTSAPTAPTTPLPVGNILAASAGQTRTGDPGADGDERPTSKAASPLAGSAATNNAGASAAIDAPKATNPYSFASQLSATRSTSAAGLPPAVEQVLLQLNRNAKIGTDQMTLQLHPADMGRVTIKLDFSQDGKVSGTVTADNPATLDLLSKDQRSLERSLQDAGLQADPGSLQFSLGGQSGQSGQAFGQGANAAANTQNSKGSTVDPTADLASTDTTTSSWYLTPGGVNLSV